MIYDVPPSQLHSLGAIQLACTARAPYLARSAVDAWLGGGHLALEITQLASSELVTNAVKYADPASASPISVSEASSDDQGNVIILKLGQGLDYLRLAVTDRGASRSQPSPIPLQAPSLNAEQGRGLAIVQALSRNRWGSYRLPLARRRVVWCHLDLHPTPAQMEELFSAPA